MGKFCVAAILLICSLIGVQVFALSIDDVKLRPLLPLYDGELIYSARACLSDTATRSSLVRIPVELRTSANDGRDRAYQVLTDEEGCLHWEATIPMFENKSCYSEVRVDVILKDRDAATRLHLFVNPANRDLTFGFDSREMTLSLEGIDLCKSGGEEP